jgi:outer membrane murein-binding lipoprotein Lpp
MTCAAMIAFGIVLSSCHNPRPNQQAQEKIDSLKHRVDSLQTALTAINSDIQQPAMAADTIVKEVPIALAPPPVESVAPKKEIKSPVKTENPPHTEKPKTTCDGCHYYNTGQLSVKKDPTDASRKTLIHFYDKQGKETYTMEDVAQSYSVSTTLHFRQDGSVEKASSEINPGASQYWYVQNITFDEENYPLKRYSMRMPYEDLQATTKKPESWDKKSGAWVRE